jgi:hypothetical protein
VVMLAPTVVIAATAASGTERIWNHGEQTVLPPPQGLPVLG